MEKENKFEIEEIWKDIPCYEGLYQVSNFGNVRSITFRNCKCTKNRIKNLKLTFDKRNYLRVSLYKKGKMNTFQVHRLVALTFMPDKSNFKSMPEEDRNKINLDKLEVNHKDEISNNNKLENLEWCTRAYNSHYATGIKRMGIAHRKEVIQKTIDNNIIRKWNSIKEASESLNICNVAIFNCCKGKSKTCNGYRWEYANE